MSVYDKNTQWSIDLKEKIKNCDEDQLLEYFKELSKKWTVSTDSDIIKNACEKLNIPDVSILDMGILQISFEKSIYEATHIYEKFKRLECFMETKGEWDRIYEVIFYS